MSDLLASQVFVEHSRFWIQRVVVPILICVGAPGNIISVIVLTRRRMRSSTNAYLTALAIVDLIYLIFSLLLSFKHYPNIGDSRFELYWRFYGISVWLCDASSSTSVWLTVSFTIERYIVVCHPMKGKVLCTEGRAKSIITIVCILCVVLTVTTPFEYQLQFNDTCVRLCDYSNQTATPKPDVEFICSENSTIIPADPEILPVLLNSTEQIIRTIISAQLANTSCCEKNYTISTEGTSLGKSEYYSNIMSWFSAIVFTIVPLLLIATFNCFLVNSVYRSYQKRKEMTSFHEQKSQTQENRITVLLIAVVILFLVCQLPTACVLIYRSVVKNLDDVSINIITGLGNIFNALLAINASANFILYCALSDKYRRTCRELFCKRDLNRQDTYSLSNSRPSFRLSKKKLLKRGQSNYVCTPKNLETLSLNSIPRSRSLMQRPLGKACSTDLLS